MAIVATSVVTGSVKGSATTFSVTIPAAGVPAHATLFVVVATASTNAQLCHDTAGNTYQVIGAVSNSSNSSLTVFRVYDNLALVSGNTITVTLASAGLAVAVSVFYLTGVDTEETAQEGSNFGTTAATQTVNFAAPGRPN